MRAYLLAANAGEFFQIGRQIRIDARAHQHVEALEHGERSGIDLDRADLHHFAKLARAQPVMPHRTFPGGEFQIENNGLRHCGGAP